jgi:hypothetical protein
LGGLTIPSVVSLSTCVAKISTDPSITTCRNRRDLLPLRVQAAREIFAGMRFKQELDGLVTAAKKKPVALKVAPFALPNHSIPSLDRFASDMLDVDFYQAMTLRNNRFCSVFSNSPAECASA